MTSKFKQSVPIVLCVLALFGLSGCARYTALALPRISPEKASQFVDSKSVSMAFRVFDKKDCIKFLDRNVIRAGYQPIHITLTNNSNSSLLFFRNGINMPTVDAKEVAKKVHTNTWARMFGYGIPASLCCASSSKMLAIALFIYSPAILVPLIGVPLFGIPAITDSIGSAEANDLLDGDYNRKELRDQKINPYETINGLVFVPKDSDTSNFQITLSELKSSQRIVLSPEKPQAKMLYA